MRRTNETWVWILLIISLLIGYVVAYYYSSSVNRWICKEDFITAQMLVFGTVASGCLFIGGFINARYKTRRR